MTVLDNAYLCDGCGRVASAADGVAVRHDAEQGGHYCAACAKSHADDPVVEADGRRLHRSESERPPDVPAEDEPASRRRPDADRES